jgi:hypothetical protein
MAHRKASPSARGFFRAPPVLGFVVCLAITAAVPGNFAAAADLSGDLSIDSTIELSWKSSIGPHEKNSITMTTRYRETTLSIGKDDLRTVSTISYEDCASLWQFALERDAGNMVDASPAEPLPDLAEFTFVFRNGAEVNKFTAYGVEFLSDTRYKEIAGKILALSKRHSPSGGE